MIFNDAAGCGATVMCYPAPAERYTADTESCPVDPDTCGVVVAVAESSTLFENPTNSGPKKADGESIRQNARRSTSNTYTSICFFLYIYI